MDPGSGGRNSGHALSVAGAMFFFFSNRLGCAGSLLISALVTLALLALLGWI